MSGDVVLIRADAGPAIGLGHVMRCLALAQELACRGVATVFVSHELPAALRSRLEREGIAARDLEAVPGSGEDAAEVLALATALGARRVVVDGYVFGSDYLRILRGGRLRLLCVDDLAALPTYDVDLLLNQNLHASPSTYTGRVAPAATLLLGPRHALLRRELLEASRPAPRATPPRTALVLFGGSDPLDLTTDALQAAEDARLGDLELLVVVGAANPRRDAVARRAEALGARARVLLDPPDMGAVLGRADVCLSAAGSSVWELARFGVPSALVVVADNQRENARRLEALGAALVLGEARELGPRALADGLHALHSDDGLRCRLSARAQELVDGEGARRVADALLA